MRTKLFSLFLALPLVASAFQNPFQLSENAGSKVIGLDTVVKEISMDEKLALKEKIGFNGFDQRLGIQYKIEDLIDVMSVHPKQMLMLRSFLEATKKIQYVEQNWENQLPEKFDLELDWKKFEPKPTKSETKFIVENKLFQKNIRREDINEHKNKAGIIFAEVLQNLALNKIRPVSEQVTYSWSLIKLSDTEDFLKRLSETKHTLIIYSRSRSANFFDLMYATEDGKEKQVAMPLFVKTGIKDDEGYEAIVPGSHSEIVIAVQGPLFNTSVVFFQGVDGIGFRPESTAEPHEWVGLKIKKLRKAPSEETLLKSIDLMSTYTALLIAKADQNQEAFYGYGKNGVCNNGTAIVWAFLDPESEVREYPLVSDREQLINWFSIDAFAALNLFEDTVLTQKIVEIMKALPDDRAVNETTAKRAEENIPWVPGNSPFLETKTSRTVLLEQN